LSPAFQKDKQLIDTVQHHFIRLVPGFSKNTWMHYDFGSWKREGTGLT